VINFALTLTFELMPTIAGESWLRLVHFGFFKGFWKRLAGDFFFFDLAGKNVLNEGLSV
jgi:hypothetical protein